MPSCCVPPRCYFRPQKLVMQEGSVTAIDEETESLLDTRPPSPLIALLGLPATTEVDLFNDTTAGSYWERSDRFDVALDLTAGRRGLAGLGDVIMRWLSHLLAIDVAIEPLVARHRIGMLAWLPTLRASAIRFGIAAISATPLRAQLVGLYRLTFREPADMTEKVRGEPVYLLAAMTPDEKLRLKPQNLVTGLPIRHQEAVN